MLALPAITVQEAIDDSLRMRRVAIFGDDCGDAGTIRGRIGRTRTAAGDHGGRNRGQNVSSSQCQLWNIPKRTTHSEFTRLLNSDPTFIQQDV